MFTIKRLNQAYNGAKRIPIDNSSKLIFFSDVHRGDNSLADEFAHNQNIYFHALEYYYGKGFTYVEVGDGDELWEHGKFEIIRYAHSDVYILLRLFFNQKRFIMLYGNHNITFKHQRHIEKTLFSFYDEYEESTAPLFPGIEVHEGVVFIHQESQNEIFVVHGHQGDFINDQIWPVMKYLNRYFWRYLHVVGFRNPASPAKNVNKRHKIEKNYNKWLELNNKILIAVHTHRPKYPKQDERPYFNTGCCIHPRNITGIEIENGKIAMIEWRIVPTDKGRLKIIRRVVRGPKPIATFL